MLSWYFTISFKPLTWYVMVITCSHAKMQTIHTADHADLVHSADRVLCYTSFHIYFSLTFFLALNYNSSIALVIYPYPGCRLLLLLILLNYWWSSWQSFTPCMPFFFGGGGCEPPITLTIPVFVHTFDC